MQDQCCKIHPNTWISYCLRFANLQIIDVLRGRGTKQIRDQNCVSVLTHGSTFMENGEIINKVINEFSWTIKWFINLYIYRFPVFQPKPWIFTLHNAPRPSFKLLSKDFICTVFLLLAHYQPMEFATTSKQASIKEITDVRALDIQSQALWGWNYNIPDGIWLKWRSPQKTVIVTALSELPCL